jgi:hypothetical protein
MKKITGKQLIDLGFIKEFGDTFHYYVYEINERGLFISCANDEKIDGGYTVEFYEIGDVKFHDINDVKKMIEIINKNK